MNIWSIRQNEEPTEEFFHVAQHIYKNDPHWLGECEATTRWQFSSGNPYFQRIRTHLWGLDTNIRVAGFFNPDLRIAGETIAFFGYFESINDPRLCTQVFAQFERWAKEQGATRVYGPIDFTTYGRYRIQIGPKQDRIPFWGEPYNPQYYQHLLTACGYSIHQQYLSMWGNQYHLNVYASALPVMQDNLNHLKITSHALTPEVWMERQEEIYAIFQALWQDNFGFVPIDLHTFQIYFSRKTAEKLDPNTSVILIDADNEVAGYFAVYPDYGPALAQGNPHRIQHHELNYKRAFPLLSNPNLLMKTGCVHPKYRQHRLFTTLSVIACERSRQYGYHTPVGCLIRADNHSRRMSDFAQRIDPRATSTQQQYGLFTKKL